MKCSDDILLRIDRDFGEDSDAAMAMLHNAINKTDYLNTDRVIRCLVFLAKGSLTDLNKYIQAATLDIRDVILWAEYEKLDGNPDYRRIRDFTDSFEE